MTATRRTILTIASLGMLAADLTTRAQTTQAVGLIEGVVRDDRGESVPRAYVAVHRGGHRGSWSVLTDEAGRFAVRGVVEGQYFVTASKAGYDTVKYGWSDSNPSATLIDVVSNRPRSIEIRIPRMGELEGSIVDVEGRPADGWLKLLVVPSGITSTGDLPVRSHSILVRDGTFGPEEVPPGAYLAKWKPDNADSGFGPTDARRIIVSPGETTRGVTIRAAATGATGRIEGTIAPAVDGLASKSSMVLLYDDAGIGPESLPGRNVDTDTGEFEFDDLLPGRYTIIANNEPAIGRAGGAAIPGSWAAQAIDVEAGSTARATVQLVKAVTIEGRLNFDPALQASRADASSVSVWLVPIDLPPLLARLLPGTIIDRTERNGRFTVRNIPAGRYALQVDNANGAWIATSVRLGGREVVDQPIDVSVDRSAIDVTISNRGSELQGTVEAAASRRPRSVAVFSDDARQWWSGSPRVRLVPITSGGTYDVCGLPPGRYLVAGADVDASTRWTNEQLTRLRAGAATISVDRGQLLTVDLQVNADRTTLKVR